jgi:hypothetical protein
MSRQELGIARDTTIHSLGCPALDDSQGCTCSQGTERREAMATTVYPAKAGAFPAVSFRSVGEALEHISKIQLHVSCGICTCPASSYARHFPDTL